MIIFFQWILIKINELNWLDDLEILNNNIDKAFNEQLK